MLVRTVFVFVIALSIAVLFSAVDLTTSSATPNLPSAAAVVSPIVKSSPSTRLIDFQIVTVTGTHFSPNARLATLECRRGASGAGGCDLSTIVYVWSNTHGAFMLRRRVRRLITVDQTVIDCAGRRGCLLTVGNVTNPKQGDSHAVFFNPKIPAVLPKANKRPVNTVISYKDGDCALQYEFGTIYGAAYAKVRAVRESIGDICLIQSQVVAQRGATILISRSSLFSCGANTRSVCSSPSYTTWRQSTIPYATGFSAHVNVIEVRNRKPHRHGFSVSAF
ncbi:MAG: neocarzinostatin apoprotein domain-containing protein [Acidimicrobiia bacterium]